MDAAARDLRRSEGYDLATIRVAAQFLLRRKPDNPVALELLSAVDLELNRRATIRLERRFATRPLS